MENDALIRLMRSIRFKEQFKIPVPKGGETEDDFISGCMGTLKDEFPDEKQRLAVCYKSWSDNK